MADEPVLRLTVKPLDDAAKVQFQAEATTVQAEMRDVS